ncbi:MAG: aspartate carbamoyltransferase regulatory subunit [Clostridium sp.]|nr:aspartate carbamoyltransferase regulatory subunit [Clostridium sp.]
MLEITSIKNGFVLDHIKPGVGVKIFKYLNLEEEGNEVALIINADSKKNGKKDIIKIENVTEVNFTVLSLLSPGITINEVKNEKIVRKIKPPLPKEINGVLKCNNPRCITSDEKYLEDLFDLVDESRGLYKCQYCDTIINPKEV